MTKTNEKKFARRALAVCGIIAILALAGCPNGDDDDDDTTPPAEVSALAASAGNAQAVLTWTEPDDADFAGVEITASPTVTGSPFTVAKGTTTKIVTGLTNGTAYTFTVKSVDTAGNKSAGATASVTPTTETGITVNADGTIKLDPSKGTVSPVTNIKGVTIVATLTNPGLPSMVDGATGAISGALISKGALSGADFALDSTTFKIGGAASPNPLAWFDAGDNAGLAYVGYMYTTSNFPSSVIAVPEWIASKPTWTHTADGDAYENVSVPGTLTYSGSAALFTGADDFLTLSGITMDVGGGTYMSLTGAFTVESVTWSE